MEANQRSMMPETRGKFNQYLLATSETAEKDYEISVRRRRQSPEPAKEQPRHSLRRIQHTGLSLPMYIHKCIDRMKEEDLGDIDFEEEF